MKQMSANIHEDGSVAMLTTELASRRRLELAPYRNGCGQERHNELYICDYLSDQSEFERRLKTLSDAQIEILSLTAMGYLNKQIAWRRGSAEGTIKSHQQEILRRLGLRSRTEAAVKFSVYCERARIRSATAISI